MNSSCDLSSYPRIRLAHLPTPLEPLNHLLLRDSPVRLFVKRDDCTGLGIGGNKTRKLEYSIADARSQGADVLITSGALQSNHARQTAAAAARVRLPCHLVLANSVPKRTDSYRVSGNLLLDDLFGATLHFVENDDTATQQRIEQLVVDLRREGRTPYVVPLGASDAVGSLGYVECARELLDQCAVQRIDPRTIILATGSGGTHAGLLTGLRLSASRTQVVGISVSEPAAVKRAKVRTISDALLDRLGAPRSVLHDSQIVVLDDYAGPAYGLMTKEAEAALRLAARREALLLDPVYTAKAMAGLLDLVRRGELEGDVIFLHTGGAPAIFAYTDELWNGDSMSASAEPRR